MGWGAAMAYYEENAEWLDSEAEAFDALYGANEKPKWRCPICNKKLKCKKGVISHANDKHKKPTHIAIIADWPGQETKG